MNTTLVVLAAGLSSRFGAVGQKVVEGIGANGEAICDYSVHDAIQAGFNKIVYVINEDRKDDFIQKVSSKVKGAEVVLAFQNINDLPEGYAVPNGRTKPWGTCHALWAARHVVNEPFMVISADDFYGRGIFEGMHKFLTSNQGQGSFAMPGHMLGETVSDHGSVSRAVCDVDPQGYVRQMREIRQITKEGDKIGYQLGEDFITLPADAVVNMLAFGFTPAIFGEIKNGFGDFYQNYGHDLTAEYYLNSIVLKLILNGHATMKVLPVNPIDRWIGITYQSDLEAAKQTIAQLTQAGKYPKKLFE